MPIAVELILAREQLPRLRITPRHSSHVHSLSHTEKTQKSEKQKMSVILDNKQKKKPRGYIEREARRKLLITEPRLSSILLN